MRNWLLIEDSGITAGMPGGGNTSVRVDAPDAIAAVAKVCNVPAGTLQARPWGPHAVLVGDKAATVCVMVADMGPAEPIQIIP